MRPGNTPELTAILDAAGITTAIVARLDFKSETLFCWTGAHQITVTGTGDSLMDGQTFEPIADGLPLEIGDNAFSYNGSEALTITLAIPTAPHVVLAAAQTFPDEYLARPATFWRALLMRPADPLAQPTWLFRRIRSGAMDSVSITNDGSEHTFALTIESHASLVSAATNASYLDQARLDPVDTSQKYAAQIANGGLAPTLSGGFFGLSVGSDGQIYRANSR